MQWAPDSTDLWAPDSERRRAWASDSDGHLTLIQAIDLFLAAKAAEGISPKTATWYRMILARLGRAFESDQGVDELTAPTLRGWIVGLQATLAPVSIAGYVRTLKAFGNWLHGEELADAAAFRGLRKPRVPVKLIEPVPDDTLRRLLGLASVRDRAIVLLLLDTGLRVSEAAGIRLGDLRPDGSVKVMGKGAKERIVPIGSTARGAIVRYIAQRGPGATDAPLFLGRRGALDWRGMQQVFKRLKTRAGITGRCSPHSLRHTFARSYLVNGGDVFSLQRILGHTTLDMVKRYVSMADTDVAAKHRTASPADRLIGKPRRCFVHDRDERQTFDRPENGAKHSHSRFSADGGNIVLHA